VNMRFSGSYSGLTPHINALVSGALGAAVAYTINLPMPWLLGTMIGTAAFALTGRQIKVYEPLRFAMMTILGVLLGCSFSPEFPRTIGSNAIIMVLILLYTILAIAFVYAMVVRTTKVDTVTAFFSAVPGGVNEMTLMGTERGGDEAALAVHHSLRLILVIFTVSVVFALAFGYSRPALTGVQIELGAPQEYAWILSLAALGFGFGRLIRLPATPILGPMILSATAHVTGLTAVKPDPIIIAIAQLVCGAALGTRLAALPRKALASAAFAGVKITVFLLLFTLLFVWVVSLVVDRPFPELLLAFAPGGLVEMGLIALSVGADTSFVSISQVTRFFIVVSIALPLFKLFEKRLIQVAD
jgi:membrane AbrB-like protein